MDRIQHHRFALWVDVKDDFQVFPPPLGVKGQTRRTPSFAEARHAIKGLTDATGTVMLTPLSTSSLLEKNKLEWNTEINVYVMEEQRLHFEVQSVTSKCDHWHSLLCAST